jgi:hypothetical protein
MNSKSKNLAAAKARFLARRSMKLCYRCDSPLWSELPKSGLCEKHYEMLKDQINATQPAKILALRIRVMTHYCGGPPFCQCLGCRTTYIGFLQMDHVAGDGATHTYTGKFSGKTIKYTGTALLKWIEKNNYPEGFQVLCANCNGPGGKGVKKQCPMHGQLH